MSNRWQEENDKLVLRDWLDAEKVRADELRQRQQKLIADAAAQLKAAIEADKKSGVAAANDLRNKRMERPGILSEKLPWDATPETRQKFESLQRSARREWYEYLTMVDPALMTDEMRRELPAAALYFINNPSEVADAQ